VIKDELGLDVDLHVGAPGKLEVLVDGERIAERNPNFVARLLTGGWPKAEVVVAENKRRRP
jgi:hypothetical protein